MYDIKDLNEIRKTRRNIYATWVTMYLWWFISTHTVSPDKVVQGIFLSISLTQIEILKFSFYISIVIGIYFLNIPYIDAPKIWIRHKIRCKVLACETRENAVVYRSGLQQRSALKCGLEEWRKHLRALKCGLRSAARQFDTAQEESTRRMRVHGVFPCVPPCGWRNNETWQL